MWIKASDISTEAFFHNAPTNLRSTSTQYPDKKTKKFVSPVKVIKIIGKGFVM